MRKANLRTQLSYVLGWLVLCLLAAYTVWQLHIVTLHLTALLIESPNWRPTGWNSSTIVLVSRLSFFVWGALYLMFIFYIEYVLRESMYEGRLLRRFAWYAGGLMVIYGVGYLIMM